MQWLIQAVDLLTGQEKAEDETIAVAQMAKKNPFIFFSDPEKIDEYLALLDQSVREAGGIPVDKYPGFSVANHQNIQKWNTFVKTLQTSSANGIINLGAIESKSGPQWLVKTEIASQSDPIMYEYYVGRRLNKLRQFIPNFVLTIGGFKCSVNLYDRRDRKAREMQAAGIFPKKLEEFCSERSGALFNDTRQPKEFIISEKISPASSFKEFANNASFQDYSFGLMQVLCALQFAQNEERFIHYDLHAENVIRQDMPIEWQSRKTVFMYNLSKDGKDVNAVFPIPSRDIWMIIDFGRAHIKETPEFVKTLWMTHPSYKSFRRIGLDPMSFDPAFDVIRIVSHSGQNASDLKVRDAVSSLKQSLRQKNCYVDERFDIIRAGCQDDIRNPLDMIKRLDDAVFASRGDRVRTAEKVIWFGYPASDAFKAQAIAEMKGTVKKNERPDEILRQMRETERRRALPPLYRDEMQLPEIMLRKIKATERERIERERIERIEREHIERERIERERIERERIVERERIERERIERERRKRRQKRAFREREDQRLREEQKEFARFNEPFGASLKRREKAARRDRRKFEKQNDPLETKFDPMELESPQSLVLSRDRRLFENFIKESQTADKNFPIPEPMSLDSLQSRLEDSIEPMEIDQIGGGESGTPLRCLYVNGRMLNRSEMISVLSNILDSDSDTESVSKLSDEQLCNAINDYLLP
jgi:hypothetical protein